MQVTAHSTRPVLFPIPFIFALILASASSAAGHQALTVSIVSDGSPAAPVQHGLSKVRSALANRGVAIEQADSLKSARGQIVMVAGTLKQASSAFDLAKAEGIVVPSEAESLLVRHLSLKGKKTLLVIGADDRGLMYALLDIAESVGFSTDTENPFSEVKDALEKPAVSERALSKYTMHKLQFESYFFDEQYWAGYLDMLAKNRFNTFALLFGYENQGYFTPPYPYFFDVDGFSEVHVVDLTKDEQKRNLDMLNKLIDMTHERGIDFTLGIWDHIYRNTDRPESPNIHEIVSGLTGNNLVPYTKAALGKFLRVVPNIDALQFRMHYESGLKTEEYDQFWINIFDTILKVRPDLRVDARAKGLPDPLIDKAVQMGIDFRVVTKYWAEQMGMPFHPTNIPRENQFERRHGYGDLLRYPKKYKMHWRLWNCGARHVLLW
ncbi:MAG: hypothetical protein J3T61_11450, partial [Candidatus Brocadiales bacterium]|nr:hypothetical protein [Candidatus Bathyanammoxibius sp.]